MKLLRQLTLIILFSLLLNSLTLILLARYQQRQLLAASQETLNHTLNHSNTVSLILAGFASSSPVPSNNSPLNWTNTITIRIKPLSTIHLTASLKS